MRLLIIGLTITFTFTHAHAAIVARINNKTITDKEFKKQYQSVLQQTIRPPKPAIFLEDLIKKEMGLQSAKKNNIAKDKEFQAIVEQELYKYFLEKNLGPDIRKIRVSKKEMRQYYSRFPEVSTSHILISIKPTAGPKEVKLARKRANEIYKEVRKSKKSFKDLVKIYTDDLLTKPAGGSLGYQTAVTLDPIYYSAVKKLKVGAISRPVLTRHGFHIIRLDGKKSFAKSNKKFLKASVFDAKRINLLNKFFAKLRRQFKITKNLGVIKKIYK